MRHLDIERLQRTRLNRDPFDYVVVPHFLKAPSLSRVIGSYPNLKGGSYPLDSISPSPALQELIDELDGSDFEQAVEAKFGVQLAGMPKMYSLRGYCRASDGKIHTDSKDKIITVLLYLNEKWPHAQGKLRLLRTGEDLSDYAEEVSPDDGTLLIFRRSDRSWHGHGPYEGVRRSIQMNWMVSEGRRGFHALRHRISAHLKRLVPVE
jgi:hypothetical protein